MSAFPVTGEHARELLRQQDVRHVFRKDPPSRHWRNPYVDINGDEFCGHCGDDWPCEGGHPKVKNTCITCGELILPHRLYCELDQPKYHQ